METQRPQSHSLNLHRLPGFDYGDPDHAYFVTARARQGSPFTDHRLAGEVVASLNWLRARRGLTLYAYCLMPDHLHLLLRVGDRLYPLAEIMRAFKSFTTHQSWKLGRRGALWQARFYDHIVRKSEDGLRIAAYILDNPVRKGLVAEAESYAWSERPDPL
ncbi:MAG: REP-associated tyrosine transposase [Chloroflexota bacterium]|nr:MAG: transposase [Chloroflexota bacterium]